MQKRVGDGGPIDNFLHSSFSRTRVTPMALTSWQRCSISFLRATPPELPGKARLARMLLRRLPGRPDFAVRHSSGVEFRVPSLKEPVAFDLLVNGCYEPETERFILDHLAPDDTFLDVGANIGVFSVLAAKKRQARVVAFEPSPCVFPFLEKNLRSNRVSRVLALPLAASDRRQDRVPFYVPPESQFGMGALAPQFNGESDPVSTELIDNVIESHGIRNVRLMKIDVEGGEFRALSGAQVLLKGKNPPKIVFEFSDWAESRYPGSYPGQAQELLLGLGYRLWRLSEYRKGMAHLPSPLTSGSEMLVASREAWPA